MFALYVAIPALILLKAPCIEFSSTMIAPAVMPWMMLILSTLLILIAGKRFKWSREAIAVLLLVVPIGNTAFMGVPMVNDFFGESGIPILIIYDQIGTTAIFAIFGSLILAMHSCEGKVDIAVVARRDFSFHRPWR